MGWFNKKHKADTADDEALLQQYRQTGDLAVLGRLYEPYMPMVFGVCLKYLQDEEQSKDAVIQIFEELVIKVTRHEVKQFKSWLYVLSRNVCLMQLRANKRTETINIDEFMELPFVLHHEEVSNEHSLTALEKCMQTLSAEQQRSVELFYIREKCYKEVAELTGFSLNEVKSYIQNGKRNLKICLEKQGER